jgi:hypothetical protein
MAERERKTGLATLPAGLLRPTTRPEAEPAAPAEPIDEPATIEDAEQGRGESAPESRTTRTTTRRKRPPVKAETARGRKISLPDEVHDRLWLLARQRRTTVSAVATEILDKNLPRWRVEREG